MGENNFWRGDRMRNEGKDMAEEIGGLLTQNN